MQGCGTYKKNTRPYLWHRLTNEMGLFVWLPKLHTHAPNTAEFCTTGVHRWISQQITKIHSTSCW